MKIFKSLVGTIFSLLFFFIVWIASDLIFKLGEPLLRWWITPGEHERSFLQELMRHLIPAGIGGYIAMLGLIKFKIMEEYNKKFIFCGFSLILILFFGHTLTALIIPAAKSLDFGVYDFSIHILSPVIAIIAAFFAIKRDII